MWIVIGTTLPILAWRAAQTSLSSESAILLCISGPLLAYMTVKGMDLDLAVGTRSPLRGITWDCVDVIAVPLALVVPTVLAATWLAVVTVATMPLDRMSPLFRNRLYTASVNGLALSTAGAAGRAAIHAVPGDVGVCVGVAVAILLFESVTFGGHMAVLARGDPHLGLIIRPAIVALPVVVAIAIGITLGYMDQAYTTTAILASVPVLLIEVMQRFGRTSMDLRVRNRERDDILRAVIEAAELQRSSLAADVHDGPLQSVLACQSLLVDLTDSSVAQRNDTLRRARAWLDSSALELRSLVRALVPEALTQLGLEGAVERDARMLERPPVQTISVECQLDGRLPAPGEGILYRAAHEALMNAVKHSGARHIAVTIRYEDGDASLAVTDNGKGGATVAENPDASDGHVGLAMVRDRILLGGGTFDLDKTPGGGTTVSVTLPLTSRHPEQVPDSQAARLARWWAAPVRAEDVPIDR